MRDKVKLVHKVKELLRSAGAPRFLHRYGPRTYELWQHVFALFVKSYCRLSYVRTQQFLRQLGFDVATKSTLQRYAKKLSLPFWQTVLKLSIGKTSSIGAIDGTGIGRSYASSHYLRRIDQDLKIRRGFYLMMLVSSNHKILSLRLRSKRAAEIKDVAYLWKRNPQTLSVITMDKAYDAEWLHQFFHQQNVKSIIPVRKGGHRGYHRKKLIKNFPQQLYNTRNSSESVFHAIKQKFGNSINSRHIHSARTEIYCQAILHNLYATIKQLLGCSPNRAFF